MADDRGCIGGCLNCCRWTVVHFVSFIVVVLVMIRVAFVWRAPAVETIEKEDI